MVSAALGLPRRRAAWPDGGHARRVVEQAVDLVGERGQVVAADGGAFLEQVIGVAFLLAGDRIDDDEDQSAWRGPPRWSGRQACPRPCRQRP